MIDKIKELEAIDKIKELESEIKKLKHDALMEERDAARRCHWCGCNDETSEWVHGMGPLMDFHLEVNKGEEGYSNIIRYMCGPCSETVIPKLIEAGFSQHHHGSTCMMEDTDCIGATYNEEHYLNECPTPEDPWEIQIWL